MKFALLMPIDRVSPSGEFQSGEAVRDIAMALERAGVSAGFLSEHPAPSADWLHTDPSGHDALDPFTALAFAAAATRRLKVLSNVVVLPYRNPFLTAKAAATLQILSDNRFILGVGVGYQQVEFDALGVPHAERGALTDEALETIELAWKGGPVVKRGRHFDAVGNEPRPCPSLPPPVWIGGGSDRAVERAARWGDGWLPYFSVPAHDPRARESAVVSMEQFREKVDRLRELRQRLGRTGPFDLAVKSPCPPHAATKAEAGEFLEQTHRLREHGATWIWTPLPAPSRAAFLENVAWFGEEIIASFEGNS